MVFMVVEYEKISANDDDWPHDAASLKNGPYYVARQVLSQGNELDST